MWLVSSIFVTAEMSGVRITDPPFTPVDDINPHRAPYRSWINEILCSFMEPKPSESRLVAVGCPVPHVLGPSGSEACRFQYTHTQSVL